MTARLEARTPTLEEPVPLWSDTTSGAEILDPGILGMELPCLPNVLRTGNPFSAAQVGGRRRGQTLGAIGPWRKKGYYDGVDGDQVNLNLVQTNYCVRKLDRLAVMLRAPASRSYNVA